MTFNQSLWQFWDNAPPEVIIIYILGMFLGCLVAYALWKRWGGHEKK